MLLKWFCTKYYIATQPVYLMNEKFDIHTEFMFNSTSFCGFYFRYFPLPFIFFLGNF